MSLLSPTKNKSPRKLMDVPEYAAAFRLLTNIQQQRESLADSINTAKARRDSIAGGKTPLKVRALAYVGVKTDPAMLAEIEKLQKQIDADTEELAAIDEAIRIQEAAVELETEPAQRAVVETLRHEHGELAKQRKKLLYAMRDHVLAEEAIINTFEQENHWLRASDWLHYIATNGVNGVGPSPDFVVIVEWENYLRERGYPV